MIENDLLRWGLAAPLLAASLYALFRAGRKSPPAIRVGFGLHAAMMTAMVLMLIPGLQWPALPQGFVFGLAAWWFVLRAVSRRPAPHSRPPEHVPEKPGHGRPEGQSGRGSLLYHALTMAAMAYMPAAMDVRGAHGPEAAGVEATGILGQAAHHGGAALAGLPIQAWGSQAALVLAVAFGLAAAVWAVFLLRSHTGRDRGGTGLELVGAASMAVMFTALAA